MRVTCTGVRDGWFDDRFGALGSVFVNGMPGLSPGFSIEDAPDGTVSFAAVLEDYDAITASGFDWVHWILCDLDGTEVPEGASHHDPGFTEGSNSWFSSLGDLDREGATGYGGMAPPNGMHRYTLTVYALDTRLGLERGFRMNDLHFAMMGHVLSQASVVGRYEMRRGVAVEGGPTGNRTRIASSEV